MTHVVYKMKKFGIENNEGVSESIGFILIFGLVLTGIALITLYGYPMLTQQQSNADVRNMEQTMVVLQNDMKALCFKNVPYKETALQVSGGSLAVVNATSTGPRLNITANGTTTKFSPGMLVYTSNGQDATIALENGAVIRAQAGGSAMIAEPRWFFDKSSKTLVINLINLTGSPMSSTGMGNVRLKLNSSSTFRDDDFGSGKEVTINITDQTFSKAWENYLTGQELEMTGSSGTYTKSDVNRLIIKKYEIQVLSI